MIIVLIKQHSTKVSFSINKDIKCVALLLQHIPINIKIKNIDKHVHIMTNYTQSTVRLESKFVVLLTSQIIFEISTANDKKDMDDFKSLQQLATEAMCQS
jgi:hypothetical protein